MADEKQIAWAAGLFEGEGCIDFRTNGKSDKKYVRLSIRMTDGDVLDRFCDIVEAGRVRGPIATSSPAGGVAKDRFEWSILAKKDVERILYAFIPYLGDRRKEKASEALVYLADIQSINRASIYDKSREEVTV